MDLREILCQDQSLVGVQGNLSKLVAGSKEGLRIRESEIVTSPAAPGTKEIKKKLKQILNNNKKVVPSFRGEPVR